MDKDKAFQLLKDVHKTLAGMGIRHFLTDGTLLGAIRGNDFIDHDTDMDIGVLSKDFREDIISEMDDKLAEQNINLYHVFGEFPKHYQLSFKRDDIKIDLFFYRKDDDKYIFHAFQNGGRNLPEDVITYEYQQGVITNKNGAVGEILFKGERFPAPQNPRALLNAKYGADWREVKEEWDWKFDPKNVVKEYE